MFEANAQAMASRMPGCFTNEFDTWLRHEQQRFPEKSDEDHRWAAYLRVMGERERWRQELIRERGARYEGCRLSNYETATEDQAKALSRLKEFAATLPAKVEQGVGLILFGPKGTGKDHLAMAMAQGAIMTYGIDVEWINGMDLFGEFRDAMNDDDKNEQEIIQRYVRHQVLYISDPVPPAGTLTEFQAATLFRILDGRYSRMKPTWVTVNVTSAAELDARIGPQNGDRLRDGAVAIFCNWASHRKTAQ